MGGTRPQQSCKSPCTPREMQIPLHWPRWVDAARSFTDRDCVKTPGLRHLPGAA